MIHSNEKAIKHKVVPLNLAKELEKASNAYEMTGLSSATFYREKAAVDEGGLDALFASVPHSSFPITEYLN